MIPFFQESAQLLQNAILNDHNVEGVHFILAARSSMEIGDNKKAEEIFAEYIKNVKGSQQADPEVFFAYADFLKKMDRGRSAIQVYKSILSFVELPEDFKTKAEKLLKGTGRLLIRPSGTEPLLRIMVESSLEGQAQQHPQSGYAP